ncbi:MAG TPA: Crp/Fnr family transcriptional regulator [Propionibacteriaceae bacterium]
MTSWPVLASLDEEEVVRVLGAGRRRRFQRGEVLFHHGDPGDSFHLVDVGRVMVRVLSPRGDQVILSVIGPGGSFGELALVDGHGHRTATVTAIQTCETISLHKTQFEQLRTARPELDRFLVASLAQQVAQLSEQLLEVLFLSTKLRVVRQLLVLGDEFDGVIPLTQEEIGLMSGTTRPTVNETLREIERTGAIRIGRGRIEVLDRARLTSRLARARGT